MRKFFFGFLLLAATGLAAAEKAIVLRELFKPEQIAVHGDDLFVLEGASVYVYSLKDFQLISRFGRTGDGPGELNPHMRYKLQLQFLSEGLLVHSWSKMVIFGRRGQYIGEKRFPFIATQVVPLEKNFAMVKTVISQESGITKVGAVIFNPDLKEIKTVYSRTSPHYLKVGKIDIMPNLLLIRTDNRELFVYDFQEAGFLLHVYNVAGDPIRSIKVDYPRQKMTRAFMDKTLAWAKQDLRFRSLSPELKQMLQFPGHFPALKDFRLDDGKIYAHTYRTDGQAAEFYILDRSGKLLKKVYLPGADANTIECAAYTFYQGKYFYLAENASEQWELKIEKILLPHFFAGSD